MASNASAQEGFGGARNAGLTRELAVRGYVPDPASFTVEGFLAEHDYPVRPERCDTEMCVFAAMGHGLHRPSLTRSAYLLVEPVSGIDPDRFERGSLNVAIVVDVSESMTGAKLGWAIAGAHMLVDRLGPSDSVSVVTFAETAQVLLPPQAVRNRSAVHTAIDTIHIEGGTNVHAGLTLGYDQVARSHSPARSDRVFLFTDEQPNIGFTDAGSFLELVGSNASRGVGITVVGVGLDLGADLASEMSQLEGGAYYYLSGERGLTELFGSGFAHHVTPVARRLRITVRPGPGLRVADVFGVPGDNVVMHPDGSATLRASTLFLDARRTGAVLRLEPTVRDGALRADAEIEYSYLATGAEEATVGAFGVRHRATSSTSLAEFSDLNHYRAYALVNYAQLLQAALAHWQAGRSQEATRVMRNARLGLDIDARTTEDPELDRERRLADRILGNMNGGNVDIYAYAGG